MSGYGTVRAAGLAVGICVLVMNASVWAQRGQGAAPQAPVANAAPAGDVIGVGTFIHSVADVNKTFTFYRALLGITPDPPPAPREYAPNEIVANLYGAPGALYRGGTLRIPNTEILGAEFGDWEGTERHPMHPNLQEPGAAILMLSVRDLDTISKAAIQNGGAIVTPGSLTTFSSTTAGPIEGQGVMLVDPDGFFIQLVQLNPLPPSAEAATTNVIGAGLAFTVRDAAEAMRYYHDMLGFEEGVPAPLYASGAVSFVPATVPTVQFKSVATRIPGTAVPVEFLQVPNPGATAFQPTIRDPGAGMLRLRVRDIDTTFAKLKAAGATVSTVNGVPVTFANGQRMVVMHDPNNFFVQPVMAAPAAASTPR
jgi:predicted enzyme related to lactoylglutathione lyase